MSHVCDVCGRDGQAHDSDCYDPAHAGADLPAAHWPPPCCRGCPCLSWEETHLPEVRAITVKQPWAWAIAHGGKTVENRSRGTRFRGPLLIHASKAWSERGATDERVLGPWRRAGHPVWVGVGERGQGRTARLSRVVPAGVVVAVAQLVDAHPDAGCCRPWGESSYTEAGGRERTAVHHLVLEDVRPLDEPVRVRGALGLWRPPLEVTVQALGVSPR